MISVLGNKRDGYLDLIEPTKGSEEEARRLRLINEFKMYPEEMKKVDDQWGPLEWRLQDAHAIFWAQQGINDVIKRFDVTGKDGDPDGVLNLEEVEAAGGDFTKLRRHIHTLTQ